MNYPIFYMLQKLFINLVNTGFPLFIGALVGAFLSLYFKRPMLRVIGGGGGREISIQIENMGIFGFNVDTENLYFLKYKVRRFSFRVRSTRETTNACIAILYNKTTKKEIANLCWKNKKNERESPFEKFKSGDRHSLICFVEETVDEIKKYYVYNYKDGTEIKTEIVLNENDNLQIRVIELDDVVIGKFDLKITKDSNGNLSLRSPKPKESYWLF